MTKRRTATTMGMAGLLAAVLGCTISGCSKPQAGEATAGGGPRPAAKVRVGLVVEEEISPEVVVVGTVVARRTSQVASGADGKVDEFAVREGDVVEESQLLSTLNMVTTELGIQEAEKLLQERQSVLEEMKQGTRPEVIAEAQARMEANEVSMRIAQEKYTRMQKIVRDSGGSRNDLDDAQEKSEAAQKLFAAAKANYDLTVAGSRAEHIVQAQARRDAQQDQVAFLKAEKEKRLTRAPFKGVVVAEHTQRGQWLSKGDLVVTLADILEEIYVVANVDERDLPHLQIGSEVLVEVDATTRKTWPGKVITVVPRSQWESGSRTFPVKVAVKNEVVQAGDRTVPVLTEGMAARVRFRGPQIHAVLVPKDSIIRSEIGNKLFVILGTPGSASGKAKPVVLTEGAFVGDKVQVLSSSDLAPGMRVVTEGAERLQPFADVEILADLIPTGGPSAGPPPEPAPVNPEATPATSQPAADPSKTDASQKP